MSEALLEVRHLEVHFPVYGTGILRRKTGAVKAVDAVDLTVHKGESLGLVGESGCGKSTTGLALLRLVEPTAGWITFDGIDVRSLGKRDLRALRRRMAMIFQDPMRLSIPACPSPTSSPSPSWSIRSDRPGRSVSVGWVR